MKATVEREKMLAAFRTAAAVAPARSPKAIVQHVKLEASDNQAVLTATDMEIGVRVQVEGLEVAAAGAALLSVDRMGSILRESTAAKLQIETTDSGARVLGERSEFQLPSGHPDEFPSVAEFNEEKYHSVSARLMRELIRRTIFATDVESSRYALGGVLLEFEPNKITAVGTDGRRLAKMEVEAQAIEGHTGSDSTTIVPTRAMQLIERALADVEGDVHLAARSNDILLRGPSFVFYSRLVEGRFPRWRDVFPARREAVRIELTVGPLLAALRQASIVTSKESRGIDFTFQNGSLVLSATTADIGQSRIELPIAYEGDELTVTLDFRYVADFLRVLDLQKSFVLEIESPETPALFTTDDGYGYVVMPLARQSG